MPPILMPVLSFIRTNWLWLLLATALASWSVYCYHNGVVHERQVCQAAAQADHDKLQAAADARAREYEADKAKDRQAIETLNKRWSNEVRNPVYHSCKPSPEFLRIYEGIAATGQSAR